MYVILFLLVNTKISNLLKTMLYTPLEQFQIILLFSIKLFCFDFSITNLVLVNVLVLVFFGAIVTFFSSNTDHFKKSSFFFIPNT